MPSTVGCSDGTVELLARTPKVLFERLGYRFGRLDIAESGPQTGFADQRIAFSSYCRSNKKNSSHFHPISTPTEAFLAESSVCVFFTRILTPARIETTVIFQKLRRNTCPV